MIVSNASDIIFEKNIIIPEKQLKEKLLIFFKNCIERFEIDKRRLCELQSNETGKPIRFCFKEVDRCLVQLKDGINWVNNKFNRKKVIREGAFSAKYTERYFPVGTVIAILPFSSPYSSIIHKIIPCVIAQNNIIVKPSPKAIVCSLELFKIIEEEYYRSFNKKIFCLNVPDYNINIELKKIVINAILFTGTSDVSKKMKEIYPSVPSIYETGSTALMYVDDSFDLNYLAQMIVSNAFDQMGLRCIGLKNLFINEKVSANLLKLIVKYTKELKKGLSCDEKTDIGNFKYNLEGVLQKITILTKNKYKVLIGGNVIYDNILEPTVLLDACGQYMSVEEYFGPILCVHIVKSVDDIPNVYFKASTLNSAIYSSNEECISSFIQQTYCGMVCVNFGPAKRLDTLSFGGFLNENVGRESLDDTLNVVSKIQTVCYKD